MSEDPLATAVTGSPVVGRTAAPNQPTVCMGSTYPPISTLLSHAGLRYPICALQGGSLIYSPMMGQSLFPWRPFTPVATPTTPVSVPSVSLLPQTTQATPTTPLSLASLMQVPGYSYMTVSSLLGSSSSSSVEETTHQQYNGSPLKRESSSENQSPEHMTKRPRLSQETTTTGYSNSTEAHTWPMAKIIPSVSLSSSPTDTTPQPPSITISEGTSSASGQVASNVTPGVIILMRCLGSVDPKLIDQYNMKVSTLVQELYYPSRLSSSANTTPTLSPETYVLLTINYLNSLRDGECISLEVMRSVFQNTLTCESQWVQYYRKHKKMTESTFVQSQFVHFARISMYCNSSRVWVIVSQNSLSEGVTMAIKTMEKSDQLLLPKFFVVLAVLQNIPIELCVMTIDEMQCRWLLELQRMSKPSAHREATPLRLSLTHEVLFAVKRSQTRAGGNVYTPFLIHEPGKEFITAKEASHMNPTVSHVIEHRPQGPFTEQYNVALHMLQRVLNVGHLDHYQRVDFFVLCPSYPPLVSQVVEDVEESGLVQLLGIADHKQEILQAINLRVVTCLPSSVDKMNDVISNHQHILFLLISKCSHTTTSVTLHHQTAGRVESLDESGACDSSSILSHSNTIMLYTSSQPYSLQTNRSLLPNANEIHWPMARTTMPSNNNQEMCSGMEYCCALKQSQVPLGMWMDLRDDGAFEEKVQQLCSKEKLTTPLSSIRAQALLNDYVAALISVVGQNVGRISPVSSLPETLAVVDRLVQGPMMSGRGQGSMVIIRCHDKATGTDIFSKLKSVRNALGLQYRFEVVLDHGVGRLNLSDYFQERLKVWGVAMEDGINLSYKELENLPCLVVMTGRVRPNVRLPSSLSHVDLRLCHTHLTRTLYESDLSVLSGYRHVNSLPASVPLAKHQSPISSFKSEKLRSTTSSSSVTSNDIHSTNNNVVEWKPVKDAAIDHTHWDNSIHSPSDKPQFEYSNTEMDCADSPVMNDGGVAIVEIPQPEDHMTDEVTNPVMDVEENLFDDLDSTCNSDYEDSETEEEGLRQMKLTCLLSRQYYLVWKSGRMISHSLLLPPSDGVIWQATSKRTILTDHAPSVQSLYYRTWSKPEGKARRVAMDMILKDNNEGTKRSFLLIGPAQVGKMGACLLLVRLLHEYLRSSQGVTAITRTPTLLPLVSQTPPPSPLSTSFSPIVSVDLLTTFNGKTILPPFFRLPTSEHKQSSVLINAHPSIAHNSSHSCPKCSSSKGSSEATPPNFVLSSIIRCNSSLLSVQWSIPTSKLDCVAMAANGTFECIQLPLYSNCPGFSPVPIFSVSPDLKELALLNVSHTADENLHVIVTKSSRFSQYQKAWPNHIIAALPDALFCGSGNCLSAVKTLAQWNYNRNLHKYKNTSSNVVPWLLILDDAVCMILDDTADESVGLSTVVEELVKRGADVSSLKHWCSRSEPPGQTYALDSNFLLLNLSKLDDFNFNPLTFKSAEIDYHLRLLSSGSSVYVPSQFSYVRKLVKPDGPISLSDLPPKLLSNPDRLVTSLHHDTSSLLSYPGPLLLETFLLHKSHTLFPFANTPHHPVLMINNYINLGPKVYVSLVSNTQLPDIADQAVFGGLVLYLCEGLVSGKMLQKMRFVSEACLLLVTRDCKGLVREVSRLDLEEDWNFKLRDEFQTSCSDQNQPLFFLTGKYVLPNNDVS